MINSIAVIGAGAWGTALALVAARAGHEVTLFARRSDHVAEINRSRENARYLPGIPIPAEISVTADFDVAKAELLLLVVPAQHVREVSARIASTIPPGTPVVVCAKGIERTSGALMSEILAETMPEAIPAILSGPNFADEVASGLPAAATLACANEAMGHEIVAALGGPAFRPYRSTDIIGAETGGAVKNVLAIACGIAAGRGLGENARAALVTRGLAEMSRFALARGAAPETLMGLSGLGDLVLSCTSDKSRNFALGEALGNGASLSGARAEFTGVTEGVHTAAILVRLAGEAGVEMPLCAAVDAVLNEGADIDETITAVMARPFRAEEQ